MLASYNVFSELKFVFCLAVNTQEGSLGDFPMPLDIHLMFRYNI